MSNETPYVVSTSPHAHAGSSVQRIMLDVIMALLPALAVSVACFGWQALRLTVVCVSACILTEAGCRKWMGRDLGIGDLSAVLTGILLAFNLPPSLPSWMAVVGCIFAMAIAIKTYFQKIADPKDIASSSGVSFTISHIVAIGILQKPDFWRRGH